MRRIFLHAALLALILGAGVANASSLRELNEPIVRERAEAHGVSPSLLTAVADCETGHTWNPRSVGRLGELGLFQLLPAGELRGFYARGYVDPFDPWESADYAAGRFAEGAAGAWSCYWRV